MDYCEFRGDSCRIHQTPVITGVFDKIGVGKAIVSLFAAVYYDAQHNEGGPTACKKNPSWKSF
jgi:hypothetical protein